MAPCQGANGILVTSISMTYRHRHRGPWLIIFHKKEGVETCISSLYAVNPPGGESMSESSPRRLCLGITGFRVGLARPNRRPSDPACKCIIVAVNRMAPHCYGHGHGPLRGKNLLYSLRLPAAAMRRVFSPGVGFLFLSGFGDTSFRLFLFIFDQWDIWCLEVFWKMV